MNISTKAVETIRLSISDENLIDICNQVKLACIIRELSVERFADLLDGSGTIRNGATVKKKPVKTAAAAKEPRIVKQVEVKTRVEQGPKRPGRPPGSKNKNGKSAEQSTIEKDVLQLIRENDRTAIGEVMENFELARPVASKIMASLLGQQLVAVEGAGRGTKYYATKQGSLEGWNGEEHESAQS